jgi:predicted XRE-type DNA-binding protein
MRTKTTKRESQVAGVGDEDVQAGSGNVFSDLGLSEPDERLAKAELAHKICLLIKAKKLTQTQAAQCLGVDQPKVSALMRGRLMDFSTERLFRFINRLDSDVLIVIRPTERHHSAGVRVIAEA